MTKALDPTLCTLALARVPRIGLYRWQRLHEAFATPAAIFQASLSALRAIGLPEPVITNLLNPDWPRAKADLEWLYASDQHHLVTINSPAYPTPLREIPDPPLVLFIAGAVELLQRPQIAIVGSRHATPAGSEIAADFAHVLASKGFAITSGLAIGIDAAAHRGALAAAGITHAVIATGPEQVYPSRHRQLRDEIAAHGTVMGENPTGIGPRARLFPQRNRIVSGLSQGVVVIQASRQSGALITARLAADQGREVFAIPGSIHDPLARGCHALLRDGAKLVESVHDILEELPANLGANTTPSTELPPAASQTSTAATVQPAIHRSSTEQSTEQIQLLGAMGHDPVTLDTLICRSGLTLNRVSSILLDMEMRGLVAALPGGRYQRRKPGV